MRPQTSTNDRSDRRGFTRLLTALLVAALTAASLVAVPPSSAQATVSSAPAAPPNPQRIMSGWMPYWTTQESLAAFLPNARLFSDVSPFWHNAARGHTISGVNIENNWLSYSNRAAIMKQLRGRGVKIMPSITDGTGAHYMRRILANPVLRERFTSQIVALVVSNRYDGIDLDFEKFAFSDGSSTWASTRVSWARFIVRLAAKLHRAGKLLAVSVPPMGTSNGNYWVYAWPVIGKYIDKLPIMAYDYSWDRPGPIGGPISWVREVLNYAVKAVPRSKIQLGTPTYGRDWVVSKTGVGCPALKTEVFDTRDIGSVRGIPARLWQRDQASRERYIKYAVLYNGGRCRVVRSMWSPDAYTVLIRSLVSSTYRINGIATWTVGSEHPSQWPGLNTIANKYPFSTTR